ncbi:MAG: heme-binding domain-containing protein [Bacteroidota bacterium]|nr:heme-binding domain-containing protein [Ignavibacteria bacterium]MCU7497848.1 heme-binding domain-containing protein [Ignavibacteria bacterium]MCU7511129.1 heme-binding domain-containing protein [Ignavibacteria bacterium]MCU7518676.1 heme-binding domain-containing protein [Ignavibacteria bacterium]MCU7522921.1 heme-binding domain-containing protein [Ignavibacteria bacterium]
MKEKRKELILWAIIGVLFLLIAIQFFQVDRDNPRKAAVIRWNSGNAGNLARRACYDCHSNETTWPNYACYAPVSWFVASDVHEGRSSLNFSEWTYTREKEAERAIKMIEEIFDGDMPPRTYLWMHPEARLDEGEKLDLVKGIEKTFSVKH